MFQLARKKRESSGGGGGGAPEWMTTYSDLVTLLMCFFVLLFSMAKVDSQKFQMIATSLQESFRKVGAGDILLTNKGKDIVKIKPDYNPTSDGDLTVNNEKYFETEKTGFNENEDSSKSSNSSSESSSSTSKVTSKNSSTNTSQNTSQNTKTEEQKKLEDFKQKVASLIIELNLDKNVKVIDKVDSVILRIDSLILFSSGKAEVKPSGRLVLKKLVPLFSKIENKMIVNGHTDNIPINTFEFPTNWELSTKRATNVVLYFQQNSSIDPTRMTASGNGEFKPIATNSTIQGRNKNRRIDIEIEK